MCIFCDIVNGKEKSYKIYENNKTLAFLDIFPISKGHILVIPKKHFENIYDIDEETLIEVFKTAKKITDILKEKMGINGVNLINSNTKIANQTVFHYHVHIIPRRENDNLNFIDEWWVKKIKKYSNEDLTAVQNELRK